ncbi:MAG: tyrosine-type recombinase/integrase [Anaerolineae bacterium]|nr:tyrosine-type recombinase/integrase [Anaerolineae bacterium]
MTNDDRLLKLFEEHLADSALAPVTIVNYLADLRAFLRWGEMAKGADCSPFCLNAKDIGAYCAYLLQTKGHAEATVNRRLQALRKFYNLAVQQGWMDANPADPVPLLSNVSPQRNQNRSATDVERLLTALQRHQQEWPPRDRAVVQAMMGAGLKLGELIRLKEADVHLDDDQPHLVAGSNPGGEPGRIVPLEGPVCDALRAYLPTRRAAPGVDRFFVNQDGRPLSTRTIQRLLRTCANAAGLDSLTAQDLRYVYARTAYDQCGDVKEIARLLGHRHLATTIRYLRPNSVDLPQF